MALQSEPLNVHERMVDREGRPSRSFIAWLTQLTDTVASAPLQLQTLSLTGQTAALGTTPILTATVADGLYRVTWAARVTTVAVTSSSLTVTLSWTDGGVACSQAFAAMTGNTTATVGSGTVLVRSDTASPISIATAYASNGAAEMAYSLHGVVEQVAA